jgi:Ca2+-binding RTX toxin-like protein
MASVQPLAARALALRAAVEDRLAAAGIDWFRPDRLAAKASASADNGLATQSPTIPPDVGIASATANAWINEFHYDDGFGGISEFVEIVVAAGTDITDWTLVLYGGDGLVYSTRALPSGTMPDQGGGFGVLSVSVTLRNETSGIALVDSSSNVLDFISYEGSITAADGPASGLVSDEVGPSESPPAPPGTSISRIGTGDAAGDFVWQQTADTQTLVNNGQTIQPGFVSTPDYVLLLSPSSIVAPPGSSTGAIYGQLYEASLTQDAGEPANVVAQLGYGPAGSDPTTSADWIWIDAAYSQNVGNNDVYFAEFTVPGAGSWSYTYRFAIDEGIDPLQFTYADLDGAGTNSGSGFDPDNIGTLTLGVDLSTLPADRGFRIRGDDGQTVGRAVATGDVNGDGFDDVILGAPDVGSDGTVYVIFGKASGFSDVDLSQPLAGAGIVITGEPGGGRIGRSVAAGDVNGDGYDDVIMGAPDGDFGGNDTGEVYVLYGRPNPVDFALSGLAQLTGFRIQGEYADGQAGFAVASADVDGDGFDDVIYGAPYAAVPAANLPDQGLVYRVFGAGSGLVDTVGGQRFGGTAAYGHLGFSLANVGDVDGDGIDDFAAGAPDTGGLLLKGRGDVLLSSNNTIRFEGIDNYDRAGFAMSSAGDVNGDGFDDFIVAAPFADGGTSNRGRAYVVFGADPGTTNTLIPAVVAFTITGDAVEDRAGFSVAGIGDFNGDGFDDIAVAAPYADGAFYGSNSGEIYVIYGQASGHSAIDLASFSHDDGLYIQGIPGDLAGYRIAGGDINGDGLGDIVLTALASDLGGLNSGGAYVIFGTAPDLIGTPNPDVLVGGDGPEIIDGLGDNDTLSGNGGDDQIFGRDGNDIVNGGIGADQMIGGPGDDRYTVDQPGDQIIEASGEGFDQVLSAISWTLAANLEKLTLTGAAAIAGTGNALANRLFGNAAANILDGGGAADRMVGGGGNDTYVVDHPGDVVREDAGGGTDLVEAGVSFVMAGPVENLTLTGSGNINATGNALANAINGNSGNNVINGGKGADVMAGGLGNDTLVIDNAGDVVSDTGGIDTVVSTLTHTLAAEFENLTLNGNTAINGTGNAAANILKGSNGANVLDGLAGADTMRGRAGNDTYVVDDVGDKAIEDKVGDGIDLVLSSVSFALGFAVDNLTLTGAAAIDGIGNALANILTGNGAANILQGGDGDDQLLGGGGDDRLFGGAGDDRLTGGAGADQFRFNAPLDPTTNVDDLLDFNPADDSIWLRVTTFTGLASGTLAAAAFRLGTSAADADDRIVYDAATGRIWFDSDGTGAAPRILFATVDPGTALTHADFIGF